jgi:hypothetical protein
MVDFKQYLPIFLKLTGRWRYCLVKLRVFYSHTPLAQELGAFRIIITATEGVEVIRSAVAR